MRRPGLLIGTVVCTCLGATLLATPAEAQRKSRRQRHKEEQEAQRLAAQEQQAQAQEARELFHKGQVAYQQGDYDTAIQSWTRAYDLDPRPLLQFNLAQAYERLGQIEQAVTSFEVYLRDADAEDLYQADARARVAALRTRLENTGVVIKGGPRGARLTVDGQDWGVLPRPDHVPLKPGEHRIRAELKGYQPFTSVVVVTAGKQIEVPVEMHKFAAPIEEPSGPDVVPAIVVMSVGGAALIAGGVLGGIAFSQADSAVTESDADSAKTMALAADISLGVGLAAAATGLVWFIIEQSGGEEPEKKKPGQATKAKVALAPMAGPTTAGAAITGRF